ncbi:fumarate/nitrate reduction transcriptional regulator Fnr [Paraburkholderia phymatum]|uniref:Transcriptional regulator, Crp/Fnr family n=1 Tax=Paraburkholderia phymatum (strain DSM 17167 / CIP 108236 / LMG 21445 / STM815) TaxID=391038 RepID=B2JVA0_PARP8|nr:fumarate/nitrate reduction transcriptional regulator Fnr [Paraburkholderia phymatum]ACC74877.1 transcriptional regulator, Crp/Fnr family [Paraburkholderia phymatum STM815]
MLAATDLDTAVALAPTSPAPRTATIVPIHPVARDERSPQRASRCSTCAMRAVCMPAELSAAELARLDSIICVTRPVKRGDTLYRAGDAFHSIYAVRAGSFKTVVMHRDGREHVTGFQIPGEALGLDGIGAGQHSCDAIALEDSAVCIIPFAHLEVICREMKPMQHHIYQMMSSEIVRESSQMMLLGTMSAEQRVATFLLNLSRRFKARGFSAAEFHLRMTREEIGCYLGMKLETVSRMVSKFQREQLVRANGKTIRIVDPEGLARV